LNNQTAPRVDVSPLVRALEVLGDPWSFLVLQEAFFGVRRFDDFQKTLGVARNTLTDRLTRLVEDEMLRRRPYQSRPERHEYRLTRRGLDTYPYALSLMRWGDDWLAGGGGPPIMLHHRTCDHQLQPLAVCGACEQEIRAEDVAIPPVGSPMSMVAGGGRRRYSSRPELYSAGRPTSVGRALTIVGDHWGFLVLWLAFAGVTKFDQFHGQLGIARTVLAARLDRLTEHGVLDRRRYKDRPRRYDYHLTPKGLALCPILLTLFDWGRRWFDSEPLPTPVLHKTCGAPMRVSVVCRHCRETVQPSDVRISAELSLGREAGQALRQR
jgi:DNA-binding HxlR family transcriptional regulator